MFKAIQRLGQNQKEVIVSLDIERVGMTIKEDLECEIQWKRGKLIDKTNIVTVKQSGSKGTAAVSEAKINQVFRKKTTMHFASNEIQPKMCIFIIRTR